MVSCWSSVSTSVCLSVHPSVRFSFPDDNLSNINGFSPNLVDFSDLDPIFKVTGGLRLLENGFSAPYLQNEWMDFD